MADRTGQSLGHYRLVRLLGQGGFAEVYLGEHVYLGTEAAIKLLHTQLAGEDMDAFRKEARTLARLIHPHIVRVFDFGIEGETPFLVMDYAPNGTVRKQHPKGIALPLPTILGYVKQVADALQYAHDEHFIHRDIKPENLLVGRRQEVLLSDFGIALLAQTSRSQSMQDVTGTASYMAPEQFQGKPRQASDQYALAVMVYEWLTGACPFHGSFTEIASQHLFVPPPPLREKVVGISPMVEQVVMTALAKDPKERFATVQAFATALEQASQMETSETLPAGQSPQPTDALTWLSESQQPTQLVTALSQSSIPTELVPPSNQVPMSRDVISEAAPTEAATRAPERSSGERASEVVEERSPEEEQLHKATEEQAREVREERNKRYPQIDAGASQARLKQASSPSVPLRPEPTAKQPPAISTPPTSRTARVSPPPGTLLYTYRGHTDKVHAVAWSPDGTRIASGSVDKTVQVWDAANGKLLLTYRGHSHEVNAIAWSPDGTRIASGSSDRTAQVWNVADGGNVYSRGLKGILGGLGFVNAVAWSPDGTRIVSGKNTTMQAWDASTGKNLLTYEIPFLDSAIGQEKPSGVSAVAWSPDSKRIASSELSGLVRVWDAANGKLLLTYRGHSDFTRSVIWSPDGTRIASGSDDKAVQVWDAANGKLLLTYRGHSGKVCSVAWSPDGRCIASGSPDKTSQVWDATTGKTFSTYQGHSSTVRTVAWSPDGTRIASGSFDNTVQVWQAP